MLLSWFGLVRVTIIGEILVIWTIKAARSNPVYCRHEFTAYLGCCEEGKGSSINDVTVLGGEGVKDFVTTVLRP